MDDDDDLTINISDAILNHDAEGLNELLKTAGLDAEPLGSWLSLASGLGNCPAMEILIAHGANVNYSSEDGETPFSWACARNQWQAARLLHKAGANINAPLSSGLTPLDVALCWSDPEFRDWLKKIGGTRTGAFKEWPRP